MPDIMNIVYSLALRLLHSFYALYLLFLSYRQRHQWKPPQPLNTARHRTPKHLALVLHTSPSHSKQSTKSALVQSVANVASWCREVGIEQLTVYEEEGLITEYDQEIRSRLSQANANTTVDSCDSSESEVEYQPLTPPPSDYSDSRPISPSQASRPIIPSVTILLSDSDAPKPRSRKGNVRRRNREAEDGVSKRPLTISLISADASKSAIATAATSMAQQYRSRKSSRSRKSFTLTVNELEALLEGDQGLPAPDFMIVHSLDIADSQRKLPLELYNFPPWQIRLTEIHHSRLSHVSGAPFTSQSSHTPYPLDDVVFREALDEFASAEFRFGK